MHGFLDFLNNPLVLTLTTVLFGLLVRYHPKFAAWPNDAIPYLNAVVAFLVKISAGLGVAATHPAAWTAAFAPAAYFATAGFLPGGIFGVIIDSVWQSVLSSLVFDKFIKPPVSSLATKAAMLALVLGAAFAPAPATAAEAARTTYSVTKDGSSLLDALEIRVDVGAHRPWAHSLTRDDWNVPATAFVRASTALKLPFPLVPRVALSWDYFGRPELEATVSFVVKK